MKQDDIQDYIIGDIVEYDNEIMVVKRVGKTFIMLFSPKHEEHRLGIRDNIKPVPLSTIILKNNGWDITEVNCEDKNQELHYETYSKCRIMADIRYYQNWSDDNRKFFVFVDSEEILHFQYVHELQHLLWAMGKDSTMIV